ncbi:hypothetical protein PSPO01_14570 [Paraphaeosphaeria sporulosa]
MSLARKLGHEIYTILIVDIDKALAEKKDINPATKVPPKYHNLLYVFSRKEVDRLPKYRPYDLKIEL